MNYKAGKVFKKYGGLKLIGQSVLDCHPGAVRKKLVRILKSRKPNTYTIDLPASSRARQAGKKGIRKLIFQSPWYLKGRYKGFVELSFQIPVKMSHFIRGLKG